MFKQVFLGGFLAIIVLVLVAATGWAAGGLGTPPPISQDVPNGTEDVDETFYVAAYHWDWLVFTEDGTELHQIIVEKGTIVEIYAVNLHAMQAVMKMPAPVAEALMAFEPAGHQAGGHDEEVEGEQHEEVEGEQHEHEEVEGEQHEEVEGEHMEDMEDMDGDDMEGVEEPLWLYMGDHGLLIDWFGVVEYLSEDADEPVQVVFTADRPGEYEFVCSNFCGLPSGDDLDEHIDSVEGEHIDDVEGEQHEHEEVEGEQHEEVEGEHMEDMEDMDGDDNGDGHINMSRIMLIVTDGPVAEHTDDPTAEHTDGPAAEHTDDHTH